MNRLLSILLCLLAPCVISAELLDVRSVMVGSNGVVVKPTNWWARLQTVDPAFSNAVNGVASSGVNTAQLVSATNKVMIAVTNQFYPTNNPAGFSPSNTLGNAAFSPTNNFTASTSGAATNLNMWARANFSESGSQRWGAQWFDSRFDLTNTDLGAVFSFSSAGNLTATGFIGDGSLLTGLTNGLVTQSVTNGLPGFSITNPLGSAAFHASTDFLTPSATNGLVTQAVTNGLPGFSVTNGLVTQAVTNGLPGYSITNSLASAAYQATTAFGANTQIITNQVQATNVLLTTSVLTASSQQTNFTIPLLPGSSGNMLKVYTVNTNCYLTFTGTNNSDWNRSVVFYAISNSVSANISFALGSATYRTNSSLNLVVSNGWNRIINIYNMDATGTNLHVSDAGLYR